MVGPAIILETLYVAHKEMLLFETLTAEDDMCNYSKWHSANSILILSK